MALLLVLPAALLSVLPASSSLDCSLSSGTLQLLVDPAVVAAVSGGASVELGPVAKSPHNPLLQEDRPWEPAAWWYSTDALLLERRSTSRENPLRNSNLQSDRLLVFLLARMCIFKFPTTLPARRWHQLCDWHLNQSQKSRGKLETFHPVRLHCNVQCYHTRLD